MLSKGRSRKITFCCNPATSLWCREARGRFMITSKELRKLVLLIFGAAAVAGGAWAQDTQEPQEPEPQTKPKPAARGIPAINDPNATIDNSEDQTTNWRPDTSPVTG